MIAGSSSVSRCIAASVILVGYDNTQIRCAPTLHFFFQMGYPSLAVMKCIYHLILMGRQTSQIPRHARGRLLLGGQ